ncbi:glycoside hydrolase domain-containing protein [Allobranchiibius sp. CTAmp26]|uniref:glycoside hydrolase domain-containing protein n=1 Tax=Allobranchiibius sp. CTAmp26 TaxID=2815214 RepID=UPI001AA16E85|nr:glycoside hydrolase domain-containing protein [Allobranchiibius sp. CTAmp26]MBO1754286.1 DUF1906 domain-containing protein [Allobranchiibius sp. CTAmp26]
MNIRRGSRSRTAFRATLIGTVTAGATLGLAAGPAGADPMPAPSPVPPVTSAAAPVSATAGATGTRTVSYGGVSVRVPAAWRVVDLDTTPGACVRLDVPTIYTGAAAAQQDCPAHLVGRADTIWLAPSAAPTGTPSARVGTMAARVATDDASHEQLAAVSGRKVVIQTTWGTSRTAVDAALATVTGTTGSVPAAALARAATSPGAPATSAAATARLQATTSAVTPSTSAFTGFGLDTCSAPSTGTLSAWKSSPYRAVGIYIGGANRACGDGNLSASWVSSVSRAGWGLIPIYVGLQAPCVQAGGLSTISYSSASSQGAAAAADAIAQARRFGIGTGRPLYFDMENYGLGSSCRSAALTFLSAWTSALHRSGYLSGVYGGPPSVMSDMSSAGSSFVAPDHVWFAYWNGLATTSAQSSYSRFSDAEWSNHQRLHQYAGNVTESWGGVRLNIDANWIDAPLAGNAVPVSYGAQTTGPVGTGFGLTGPMSSWHTMTGQGLGGHALYTGSSGASTEVNGATWSMYLAPGSYSAMAYVPSSNSSGRARYSISGSGVAVNSVLDQSTAKGYRSVGTFTVRSAGTVSVHVGDNGGSAAHTPFAVDAMWFKALSATPPPPTAPPTPAVPGRTSQLYASVASGGSTVRWAAPTTGGAVTSYTVTASPGGRSATVGASLRKATVTGLSNGTTYHFTVVAKNAGGSGPGVTTGTVVPTAPTRLTAVTPARLVDTRFGTRFNAVQKPLAPGASLKIWVSGLVGSPVPSSATGAQLHVSVSTSEAGWLSTPGGAVVFGGSQVSSSSRLFPLTGRAVTVTNHGPAAVHLMVDVEAYASTAGSRWTPTSHTRIVDTRVGTRSNTRRAAIPANGTVTFKVAGAVGSPVPTGSASALLNVTTTSAASAGYLTVSSNTTSVLAFGAQRTVASTALVRLGSGGTVTVTNKSAHSLQVIIDVQGYGGASGGQWTQVPSTRILSGSAATVAYPHVVQLAARASITVQVRDTSGTPLPGTATAAEVVLDVESAQTAGYLTNGTVSGSTSLLGFAGGSGTNTALLPIGGRGTITITNVSGGSVRLTLDVTAYTGP